MVIKLYGGFENPSVETLSENNPLSFSHTRNHDLNMFKRYYPHRSYIPNAARGGAWFHGASGADTLGGRNSLDHDDGIGSIEIPIEVLSADETARERQSTTRSLDTEEVTNRTSGVVSITDEDDSDKKYQPPAQWILELNLTSRDKAELVEDDMLTDKHIFAAQTILHKQFPNVSGFQDTCLSQIKFEPIDIDPLSIQIHHTRGHHWAVSAAIDGQVYVFDTLYDDLSPDLKKQLLEVYAEYRDENYDLTVVLPDVQLQAGVVDCGLFAIAIAYDLCCGRNIEGISYNQEVMRNYLLQCFEEKRFNRFPYSVRNRLSSGNVEIIQSPGG